MLILARESQEGMTVNMKEREKKRLTGKETMIMREIVCRTSGNGQSSKQTLSYCQCPVFDLANIN